MAGVAPADSQEYLARYTVVKHSWKGKYTRIFCISKCGVATINPNSIFKITNIWDYSSVVDVVAAPKSTADISVSVRTNGKPENLVFSCMSPAERAELLSDVQAFRPKFDAAWARVQDALSFPCRKYRSTEEWGECSLVVGNTGIKQYNARDHRAGEHVGTYQFIHCAGFARVEDNANAIVIAYGRQKRLHMYESDQIFEVVKRSSEMAQKYLGLPPIPELPPMPFFQFEHTRLNVDRSRLASTADFPVMKTSLKHQAQPIRRQLSTTDTYILERDVGSYDTVSVFPLDSVFALIRSESDAQQFSIEYKDPHIFKTYTSPVRDALLAHIVDACRGVGNTNACVLMTRVDRGKRAAPCRQFVPEEIESTLLKCLIDPAKVGGVATMRFNEVVEFFNANVECNGLRCTENKDGLFAENREKLIFGAFISLLDHFPESDDPRTVVQQFYALRRLSVSRIGFASAAVVPSLVKSIGAVSVRALKTHHSAVSHAVIDFLTTLMAPHHDNYDVYHEQVNKNRMLASESFVKHLVLLLRTHAEQDSGALVIQALLDFFVFAVCPPYSETTDQGLFERVVKLLVDHVGKTLFYLFLHTCKAIRFSAGQILRVIMEEGDEDQFFAMQRAALSEGGYLRQFSTAAFSNDRDLRDLARRLIALWTADNTTAQDLLRRMIPITLLHFLQDKEPPPASEQEAQRGTGVTAATVEWNQKREQAWFKKRFHPRDSLDPKTIRPDEVVILRTRDVRVVTMLNWPLFFYQLKNDHTRPDLIWNHNTRNELREALEAEMSAFQLGLELRKERNVCWNYQEFEVTYPSLAEELRIGNHYPRLLFETANPVIARPKEFFNDMYHRFLLVQDFNLKNQCLHGMSLLYKHYAEEIGAFHDIEFMIQMLDNATHPTFRDRMLQFLSMLLHARHNVKPFIDCNGMKPLIDLVALAHLHVDRPQIHSSSMAIEGAASPADIQDQEKEWHYTNKAGEKCEPVSYTKLRQLVESGEITATTKMWAQGLGGWRDLKDVAQLKWGILAKGLPSVMTLTELSCTILDIFALLCAYYPSRDEDGSVMQPLPRVKRYLSGPTVLPHIVQLLLTFDPSICNRVHRLLFMLMEDNPLMPRFFLTGVYFFSLMYMGSDIIPLCRLLAMSHRKQSFQMAHDNEIVRSSVLSPMLPPAMVCFLSNHGPEKFAEIFLGEYETPETIWGKEMRRFLVEKIAVHIADFTPRILGNVRVMYQYCPIVGVEFEQLKNELFCSQYYLRHLCDELKYPVWPVADPIALLRDVLCAWRVELDKKPTVLSRDKCLEELEIKEPNPTQSAIRKAYFKLAAVYHPDKNPTGRERFEAIQEAYTFLASEVEPVDGPDPKRIALLIRAQSILFSRFPEKMAEYKYAGYELLLKLIRREFEDPEMLTKPVCLMEPATELVAYTVGNAALNADELQEEGGIELLAKVLTRSFELFTPSIKDTCAQAKVATNCIRALGVAAQFPDCSRRIISEPSIVIHCARGIAYEKAPVLSRTSVVACTTLALDETLQAGATNAGAVWHLLLYLFRYDPTLEDSGVAINENNHTQLFANRAAKNALRSICALAGYRPNPTDPQTKPNVELHKFLMALLTSHVVNKMSSVPDSDHEVLRIVNGNHETPYMLWNNTSRAELKDFLQTNSDYARDNASPHNTEMPPLTVENFAYSAHQKELVIGGVFVRIYNAQPQFPIENPPELFQRMLEYLQAHTEAGNSDGFDTTLEAMRNLLIAYPATHTVAASSLQILFRVLTFDAPSTTSLAFDLLAKCCCYPACIEGAGAIATAISDIVIAMQRGEVVYKTGLSLVQQLLTDSNCVQQFLDRGMYVVVMHVFATSRNVENKELCCACISKACGEKLGGPKVVRRVKKLIPGVFVDMMRENPAQAAQMFDTWQENPELVWNAQVKERVVTDMARARASIVETLTADRSAYWKMSDVGDGNTGGIPVNLDELQVGDVYLTLFLKQPNWAVRKPRDFLMSLLEFFVQVCHDANRSQDVLDLITQCLTSFLAGQPSITDYIVALGYIDRLLRLVESSAVPVSAAGVRVIREVANSKACVESMGSADPVAALLVALDRNPDDVGSICDALERLMARSSEKANMVRLALSNKLLQKLLSMLESGTTGHQNPAQVRAILVRVIKTISKINDPVFGPQVASILQESSVWWKYKDQSHDLFLTGTTFGGYLTGPRSQPVLSLAAPPTQRADDEPPPLD